MNGLYKLKNDTKKETEGIPLEFIEAPNDDKTVPTVYVKPMHNEVHKKAIARNNKPFARQIRLGQMSDEKAEELATRSFVEGCIAGWANIQDENGVEIPFSIEAAIALFTAIPPVKAKCLTASLEEEAFRVDTNEEIVKN